MKNYGEVVGIDISKKTIDGYCYQAQEHKVFVNEVFSTVSITYSHCYAFVIYNLIILLCATFIDVFF